MDDFFPKMSMKPNPDCDEYHCKVLQKLFAEKEAERLKNQPNGKWNTVWNSKNYATTQNSCEIIFSDFRTSFFDVKSEW